MPTTTRKSAVLSPFSEGLRPVGDVLQNIPGGRPSPAVIHRWVCRGLRGHRLPALKVRGHWHTTREACEEWFRACSAVDDAPSVDHDSVDRELAARGYA